MEPIPIYQTEKSENSWTIFLNTQKDFPSVVVGINYTKYSISPS